MNITSRDQSKSRRVFTSILLLLTAELFWGCWQGPWDFWPSNPARYRGIWSYAHVVTSRPITNVCFSPVIPLDHVSTDFFPFYDSAHVQINGQFSGEYHEIVLTPQMGRPNCFDGPESLIASKDQDYSFAATFRWDSSGTIVTSHFSATAHTPELLTMKVALTGLAARPDIAMETPEYATKLAEMFSDFDKEAFQADPALRDSFWGEHQVDIFSMSEDTRIPLDDGDSIYYLNPPIDLNSHKFAMDFSSDVEGILITQFYDSTGGVPENSFDYILPGFTPDTSDKWESGNHHRLMSVENIKSTRGTGNLMDTLSLSNVWFKTGWNKLYFYAVDASMMAYISNSINGAEDSRLHPKTNIEGGQGIFGTMTVDSFSFTLKPLPNTIVYPLPRARILYCRNEDPGMYSNPDNPDGPLWMYDTYCRTYLPSFCKDSMSTTADCRPLAVVQALENNENWDTYLLPLQENESEEYFALQRQQGERMWCFQHNFPANATCDPYRADCLESEELTQCKQEFWYYCEDRGWPLDSLNQCGNALVSWMRLQEVKSTVFEKVKDQWCQENANDTQCDY